MSIVFLSNLPSIPPCAQVYSWLHWGQMRGEVFRGELGLRLHRDVLVPKGNDLPPRHRRMPAMCPRPVGRRLQGEVQVKKTPTSFFLLKFCSMILKVPHQRLPFKSCNVLQVRRRRYGALRSHGRPLLLQRKQVRVQMPANVFSLYEGKIKWSSN